MDPIPPKSSDPRKWYAKKRFIIPLGLALVLFIALLGSGDWQTSSDAQSQVKGSTIQQTPSFQKFISPAPVQEQAEPDPVAPPGIPAPSGGLSNDNYYINVDGNEVHSPAYSDSIPAGASAQCRDGTYSFSQNRRGTCSHHGGVAEWY